MALAVVPAGLCFAAGFFFEGFAVFFFVGFTVFFAVVSLPAGFADFFFPEGPDFVDPAGLAFALVGTASEVQSTFFTLSSPASSGRSANR